MGNVELDVNFLVTNANILNTTIDIVISPFAKTNDVSANAVTDNFQNLFKDIDKKKTMLLVSFLETLEPRRLATISTYKQQSHS